MRGNPATLWSQLRLLKPELFPSCAEICNHMCNHICNHICNHPSSFPRAPRSYLRDHRWLSISARLTYDGGHSSHRYDAFGQRYAERRQDAEDGARPYNPRKPRSRRHVAGWKGEHQLGKHELQALLAEVLMVRRVKEDVLRGEDRLPPLHRAMVPVALDRRTRCGPIAALHHRCGGGHF